MMRKIIEVVVVPIFLFTALLSFLFVPAWYDHSKRVQQMVDSGMTVFEQVDIDYAQVDRDNIEELTANATDVISAHSRVMGIRYIRDELYAYRDAVYDLFPILLHDPENKKELELRLQAAHRAQIEFYSAVERFQTNRLIAMWYTL